MLGKVACLKKFTRCIRYVLEKDQAVLLDSAGVRSHNVDALIQDFNLQRSCNPNVRKPVGHISLSWSKEDQHLLNPIIMAERAREYLKLMEIENTQYIIVQHKDRQHPHLHIVYNRVDNLLKTISDSYSIFLNIKVCKSLRTKYGYQLSKNKRGVNRDRLWGKEKVRYELFDAISDVVKVAASWRDFENLLKQHGIELRFKYLNGTNKILGVSFGKARVKIKGSAIDKELSYQKLNSIIENNQKVIQRAREEFVEKLRDAASQNVGMHEKINVFPSGIGLNGSSIENTLSVSESGNNSPAGLAENDNARKKRKSEKKNERHTESIDR
jgi:hypothetical protein